MEQRCGRCKATKDETQFSPSYRGKNGTWCRACFAAHKRGESVTTSLLPPRECDHCGASYHPKVNRKNLRFCSVKCNQAERLASGSGREAYLLRKFGITQADYDAMLAEQGGGCALCGKTAQRYTTYLHVDHDHATGRIRGLLCDQHNLILGRFNDDPAQLRRAADYLESGAP